MLSQTHSSQFFSAVILTLAILSTPCVAQQPPGEANRAERMQWWNEARFGMFIHWGLYAIPAGEWNGKPVKGIGEWIQHKGQIPVEDYKPLASQFNPVKFKARQWVRLMKEAGCRYFVITTKHHDGFALFRSDVSDYDIAATPFGKDNDRDIMRELADAARAEGIRIGWYHSIMDWQHPDYLPRRSWEDRPVGDADFDRYREYLHAQVREILTNYGDIDVIWFDGEWEATWTHEHGIQLHEHCMRLSPRVLVNNRVDKGRKGMEGMNREGDFRGDFGTPEQEIPEDGFGEGVYWESCMTMNDTWGFKANDHNWKSAAVLIQNLIDTASKGGNYLLNVGPTAAGEIPQPSVERLKAIGAWLKTNGESIYGTSASPIGQPPWGRVTQKDDGATLYLHVFDWPSDGKLVVDGLTSAYSTGVLLDGGKPMEVKQEGGKLVLELPSEAPDEVASVVRLER